MPSPQLAHPLEVLWQPRTVFGVILSGQGLAAVLALAPGLPGDRWVYFGLASLMVQWTGLLSLAALFLARQRLQRLTPLQVAWAALGIVVLMAISVGLLAVALAPEMIGPRGPGRFLSNLLWLSLTVGLLGIAAFHVHWRNNQLALRAARAELEALQARIRPHFIFNTLNTGAALVHARPEAAEHLLLDLADLFRASLQGEQPIPLAEELDLCRRYLDIEQLRFGDRLRVEWDMPQPPPALMVPALSMQPLVENAVRHGIEPSPQGGTILVKVSPGRRRVQVLVQNPVPSPAGREDQARSGFAVGLASAKARLNALTGGRAEVAVESRGDVFRVTVALPASAALRQPPPGSTDGTPR
ncbi:MAG: sensor histidine kinase [Lysobacteraceae bacterium]